MLRLIKDIDIKFMAIRRMPIFISSILLIICLASIVIKGFNFGIDFSSGYIVQLKFDKQISIVNIENKFSESNIEDVTVQLYGSSKDVLIKLKDEEIFKKNNINNFLNDIFSDESFTISKLEYVGAQVGSELREKGEWAMLIALFSILIYVAIRFELIYGLGAITALIHDVIITLGVFSLFELTFDLSVLAAILAVIGYSLNDTSLTTLLVIISLLIFGGDAVKNFSIAMFIGIIVGTYSSIFVASTSLSYFGIQRPEDS